MDTVNDFNRHGLQCLAGAVLIMAAIEHGNDLNRMNADVLEFYCDIAGVDPDYLKNAFQQKGISKYPFGRYVRVKGGD